MIVAINQTFILPTMQQFFLLTWLWWHFLKARQGTLLISIIMNFFYYGSFQTKFRLFVLIFLDTFGSKQFKRDRQINILKSNNSVRVIDSCKIKTNPSIILNKLLSFLSWIDFVWHFFLTQGTYRFTIVQTLFFPIGFRPAQKATFLIGNLLNYHLSSYESFWIIFLFLFCLCVAVK